MAGQKKQNKDSNHTNPDAPLPVLCHRLAVHVAAEHGRLAPDALNNLCLFQDVARHCRLGSDRPGAVGVGAENRRPGAVGVGDENSRPGAVGVAAENSRPGAVGVAAENGSQATKNSSSTEAAESIISAMNVDDKAQFSHCRPYSGVTAVVDFCAHSHQDTNNILGGSTAILTFTRPENRPGQQSPEIQPGLAGLQSPENRPGLQSSEASQMDEQLHVLPKYVIGNIGGRNCSSDQQQQLDNAAGQHSSHDDAGGLIVLHEFRRTVTLTTKKRRQQQLSDKQKRPAVAQAAKAVGARGMREETHNYFTLPFLTTDLSFSSPLTIISSFDFSRHFYILFANSLKFLHSVPPIV